MDFRSAFMHLREAFEKLNKEKLPVTAAEALLAWLQVYPLERSSNAASTADFTHSLWLIWPDIRILAEEQPIALSSTPPEEEDNRSFLAHLFGLNHPHLNIAFVYDCDPEEEPLGHGARAGAARAGGLHGQPDHREVLPVRGQGSL